MVKDQKFIGTQRTKYHGDVENKAVYSTEFSQFYEAKRKFASPGSHRGRKAHPKDIELSYIPY